jgi:hypothetical protein
MFDVDIIVEMAFFVFSKVLQPQSVRKDVECTDQAQQGFGGKNAK